MDERCEPHALNGAPMELVLRDVDDRDMTAIFEMQRDRASVRQAAFGPQDPDDRGAFDERWRRIRAGAGLARVVTSGTSVAGNILSWTDDGRRYVAYWVARDQQGTGVATFALTRVVTLFRGEPLYAWVADDNVASRRVLERCGFRELSSETSRSPIRGTTVRELLYHHPNGPTATPEHDRRPARRAATTPPA